MASFVLPIPIRKSGAGGGKGAEPKPSLTLSIGKPNSWTLCKPPLTLFLQLELFHIMSELVSE